MTKAAKKSAAKKAAKKSARKPAAVLAPAEPTRSTDSPEDRAEFFSHLLLAASVCSERARLEALRNIAFKWGRMQAFDGVVRFQAPTPFPQDEDFAVSGIKLSAALRSLPDMDKVTVQSTEDHLKLKRGPLSVRVRKLSADSTAFFDRIKMSRNAQPAGNLIEKLRAIREFVSEDASRLWSVSVLLRNGHLFATNNLSLVRAKVDLDFGHDVLIPASAVSLLCELDSADRIEIAEPRENAPLVLNRGRSLFRFPQHAGEWPDVEAFFKKMPKKLPPIPPDMLIGSKVAERFSERFTSLAASRIESKGDLAEVEYEVEGSAGKGVYSAKLLTLILSHATHADFSRYPEPIFFSNEHLEGTAVGMREGSTEAAK